jgi:hypothetical protein
MEGGRRRKKGKGNGIKAKVVKVGDYIFLQERLG